MSGARRVNETNVTSWEIMTSLSVPSPACEDGTGKDV
jgi:hypothetical protein